MKESKDMAIKPRILVTSAVGHVGRETVLQLLKADYPVRAFVRRVDTRSMELERAGAEIFAGDLYDIRDLRRALADVQRALHCPPFSPNNLHDSVLFAIAAEEAKLDVVVRLGAWNVHESHPSIHQRSHWMAGQIYRWIPSVDTIALVPGFFAFPYFMGIKAIVHFGQLMLPLGEGLNAPPSNEDIARVAVAVLENPASHIGRIYRPTGPQLLSPSDIAGVMSHTLERPVSYKNTSFRMFQKAAQAQGFPLSQIAHIRHYAEEVRNGVYGEAAPTNHVEAVTGAAPESFETTARRYLSNPDCVYPGLAAGSRASAIAFLARMMMSRPVNLDAWEQDRGYPMIANAERADESAAWQHGVDNFDVIATIDSTARISA